MEWIEAEVIVHEESVEAIEHFLQNMSNKGTVVEESHEPFHKCVKAYFTAEVDATTIVTQIEQIISKLPSFGLNPGYNKVNTRVLPESDWENEWKQYYKPIQVTPLMTIQPSWESYHPRTANEIVIELEPGMAFGTGMHPSTIFCLQLMEKYVQKEDHVIDVGCGSGILSIAAAKLGANRVLSIDNDPIAIRVTKENLIANQVAGQVSVKQGDLLKQVSHTADLVVANILAEVIGSMSFDLPRVLVPGGILIASGIIAQKADDVQQICSQAGLILLDKVEEGDWVAMAMKKW